MRLGLSARKTALQLGVLVIYRLQGQVPVARWRRKTASRQTQSLARFTGKGCHLVAKGQAVPSGRRPRLGKAGLWRIDGIGWRRVRGCTVLFLKSGPAECQWSAGGTEQGCLPSCLRTRHGAWMCARAAVGGGGEEVGRAEPHSCSLSPLPVVPPNPRSVVSFCPRAGGSEAPGARPWPDSCFNSIQSDTVTNPKKLQTLPSLSRLGAPGGPASPALSTLFFLSSDSTPSALISTH